MKIPCPFCTQELLYDPNLAGKTVACSYCKKNLLIPSLQQLPIKYQQEYREEQDHLRKKQEAKQKKFEKQVDEELQRQRQEQERLEQKRLEQEQLEQKRLEQERLEQKQMELGKRQLKQARLAAELRLEREPRGASYPALRSIAVIYRIAAVLAVAAGVLGSFAALGEGHGALIVPIVISVVVAVLCLILAAESIELFVNIADDIRESTALLKGFNIASIRERQPPSTLESPTSAIHR